MFQDLKTQAAKEDNAANQAGLAGPEKRAAQPK